MERMINLEPLYIVIVILTICNIAMIAACGFLFHNIAEPFTSISNKIRNIEIERNDDDDV